MYLIPDVSKWIAEWLKNLYILSVLLNGFLQCWQLSTISCVKTFGSNVGHFLLVFFFGIQVAKSSLFNGVVSSLAPRWQDYQSWWRTVWGPRGSLPASLNQCWRGWCGWVAFQHHPGCWHWYQVRAEHLESFVWAQGWHRNCLRSNIFCFRHLCALLGEGCMLGMGLRLSFWSLTSCLEIVSVRMGTNKILKAIFLFLLSGKAWASLLNLCSLSLRSDCFLDLYLLPSLYRYLYRYRVKCTTLQKLYFLGQVWILQAHCAVWRVHHVPWAAFTTGAGAETALPGTSSERRRGEALGGYGAAAAAGRRRGFPESPLEGTGGPEMTEAPGGSPRSLRNRCPSFLTPLPLLCTYLQ